jgi:hypothetical protein
VTIGEIAALLRRHIIAVIAVIAAAAAVSYGLARAPVIYQESGTLYFHVPSAVQRSKLSTQLEFTQGETAVVAIFSNLLMSSNGQRQVRSAGAVAQFDVAPVNVGSLQYPDYADPDVSVTTSGTDPAKVRTSFAAVTRVLSNDLAALQAQVGAPAGYRLKAYFSNGPSLQAEPGSSTRVYGGLAVLAIVAIFAAMILLERRRPRSAAARRPAAQGSGMAASQRG